MADKRQPGDGEKAPRRRAVKAAKSEHVGKVKVTYHLSPEAANRIAIHAVQTGQTKSAVVESIAGAHLRRWVVSDREKKEGISLAEPTIEPA